MTAVESQTSTALASPVLTFRELLSRAAQAVQPLLNRIVFTGGRVASLLATDDSPFVGRSTFRGDSVLRVLSSSTLDRIGADLQRLGFHRGARTASIDRWHLPSPPNAHLALDVTHVAGDASDDMAAWVEYASLVTSAIELDGGVTARVTAAPALLALLFAEFRAKGEPVLDSEELDDVIALAASRGAIVREVAASPPELRAFITTQAAWLADHDSAGHLARGAIPSFPARHLSGIAEQAIERLRHIAAVR